MTPDLAKRAAALLRKVEFAAWDIDARDNCCPSCGWFGSHNDEDGCELAAVLKELEEVAGHG